MALAGAAEVRALIVPRPVGRTHPKRQLRPVARLELPEQRRDVVLDSAPRDPEAGIGQRVSYEAATDRYSYVWTTDRGWRGTCRQLIVRLSDGSIDRATFKFTQADALAV